MEKPLTFMRPILGRTQGVSNRRGSASLSGIGVALALGLMAGLLGGSSLATPQEPLPIMPLNEVQPGMRGIGWSVFQGSRPDTFGVEIIGVQRGTGPKSSLILFRGEGAMLEKAGIIAGMSGSPVLVDGKLIGAAAFAYPYSKEPIGAITPIEEMLPLLGLPADTALAATGHWGVRSSLDGGPDGLVSWMESVRSPRDWIRAQLDAFPAVSPTGSLAPIRTPVSLSAWAMSDLSLLEPLFEEFGWIAAESQMTTSVAPVTNVASGGSPGLGGSGDRDPLGPGSAVGVRLVGGDANIAATGTVTYRDGDRLLAFGHPMFFAGALPMPLVRVHVHDVLPSRLVSFKISTPEGLAGTLVQDRRTGVYALLGTETDLLPVRVNLASPMGENLSYSFDLVRHQLLTPILLAWVTSNSFDHVLARAEPATAQVTVTMELVDGRTLAFSDLLSSRQPGGTLGLLSTQLATYLLSSTFAPFPVQSVEVEAKLERGLRRLYVERIQADRSRVSPGETVQLSVSMREHDSGLVERTFEVPVPPQVLGDRVIIMATSLTEFLAWDQERAPGKYAPQDFDHLYSLLQDLPSQGDLVLRVYSPSAGAILRGRELGSLPASTLRVLEQRTAEGTMTPVSGLLVHEERVPMGAQVLGGTAVVLQLDRKGEQ
jgi:hypothetical protein